MLKRAQKYNHFYQVLRAATLKTTACLNSEQEHYGYEIPVSVIQNYLEVLDKSISDI